MVKKLKIFLHLEVTWKIYLIKMKWKMMMKDDKNELENVKRNLKRHMKDVLVSKVKVKNIKD